MEAITTTTTTVTTTVENKETIYEPEDIQEITESCNSVIDMMNSTVDTNLSFEKLFNKQKQNFVILNGHKQLIENQIQIIIEQMKNTHTEYNKGTEMDSE